MVVALTRIPRLSGRSVDPTVLSPSLIHHIPRHVPSVAVAVAIVVAVAVAVAVTIAVPLCISRVATAKNSSVIVVESTSFERVLI